MNENRIINRNNFIKAIKEHKKFNNQFEFPEESEGMKSVWFGLVAFLKKGNKETFLKYLLENKIENRPIVSGNFVRQPALKKLNLKLNPEDFKGAEYINENGFFIGLHSTIVSDELIKKVVEILFGFNFDN